MANGESIYFLDAGQAVKREVQGFFSPDDLENQLFLRENRLPFAAVPINTVITDRPTSRRRSAASVRRWIKASAGR